MKRRELWEELATTSDELSAAFEAYRLIYPSRGRDRDTQFVAIARLQKSRLETAVQHYSSALEPVVGVHLAFDLHSRYRAVMDALDEQERLIDRLTSTESPIDDHALKANERAIEQALRDLDRAQQGLVSALDAAARRDRQR